MGLLSTLVARMARNMTIVDFDIHNLTFDIRVYLTREYQECRIAQWQLSDGNVDELSKW